MRELVLFSTRRKLGRSAAALALSAVAAGCSADVGRFDDGFYTGAVPQAQTARAPVSQPYPGGVDQMSTGSVAPRQMPDSQTYAAAPTGDVSRSSLAPPPGAAGGYQTAAAQPSPMPAAAPALPPAQPSQASAGRPGWSGSAASLTLQPGETVEAVAQRFRIPVETILAANGMSDPSQARPGQSILIPNYDHNSRVAAAAPAPAAAAQPQVVASAELPANRGAPPTTLAEQARSIAVPRSAEGRPAAAAPAQQPRGVAGASVTVASGDSLNAIARRTGVSVAALREANGITGDNIRIGQTLRVPMGGNTQVAALQQPAAAAAMPAPTMNDAPVQAAAPMPTRGSRPQAAAEAAPAEAPKPAVAAAPAAPAPAAAAPAPAVAAAPAAPAPAAEAPTEVASLGNAAEEAPSGSGISQFRWPVQGRVVKGFGDKVGSRRNDGLDISVPQGTPIKAAENGVVIYAGDGLKEFGNTVLVRHDNGLVTVYGHADQISVKRGATVKRGQDIATAGMSGDTDVPKVHFEVRKDSSPVDPMTFLR